MAGPGFPTNIDAANADDPNDPTAKQHQQLHDQMQAMLNGFDTGVATAADGRALVSIGGLIAPQRLYSGLRSTPQVGDWLYQGCAGTNTFQPANGTFYGGPYPMMAGSWDQVRPSINTAGSAGALGRVIAFLDNGSGRPGSLLWDSGTFDGSTSGIKILSASFSTTYGPVWWFVGTQGAPATTITWSARGTDALDQAWPASDTGGPIAYYSATAFTWAIDSLTGAPSANPTVRAASLSGVPRFAFRRSA